MDRIIEFTYQASDDLNYFKKSGQTNILKRIRKLIESVKETPYKGIGKPEALKYELSAYWSRRINREHRLVYRVTENKIYIISLRGHY